MIIVKNRILFFCITGAIVLAALFSTLVFGLKLGTDFTGGALVQVTYPNGRPTVDALTKSLTNAKLHDFSVREAGDKDYVLRTPPLTTAERAILPEALNVNPASSSTITQMSDVGPTIGAELRAKALLAMALVLICILLFIAFAFRKVSVPVSSWIYGLIALITLIHDVIIPVGFFALLGHLYGAEVDTLFVTAVLTVLGFSIHDTIVVFDRVRENLAVNKDRNRKEPFEETAGRALNQTFVRSINTSLTVVFTLLVLFFAGPASTQYFALTLLVGIIAGTYSSIFLATPLLVVVADREKKRK